MTEVSLGRWIANGFSIYVFRNHKISGERKIMDISIKDSSDIPIEELQGNMDFCVEAMNQCQQVNSENPLVVAENITAMVKMLNDLSLEVSLTHPVYDLLNKIAEK